MKFTIDRSSFLKPLGHIYSVVERRNTIPILSNVLIESDASKVSFTATDMDMDIVETVGCIVSSKGKLTVSAHTLYDIVRKLPDGSEIQIELVDLNVEVSAGKSRFILPTLPVDDYPVMTEIEKGNEFSLEAVDLANLIDNTKFAISSEETRYYLNGIYLHVPDIKSDKLRAVATDGHRLAQAEVPIPKGAENMPGVILPRKAVGEVRKLIDSTDGLVTIIISKTKAKFIFPNSILTTKLIDGSFPDYQRVIPKENLNKLVVSNADFSKAIDRVSTVSMEKSRAVKLSLSNNVLLLQVNSHDLGNASEELDVNYTSDPIDIGFNSRYLLDISGQIQGKDIELSLSDSASPALITDPDQEGVIFVLMPMRV
ncbi:MAG: DNA polymerase III subunit beta [Proteobacteria bacterium]|jgi:DNA polymerase-3 subunit beta|nr:DNA polymerase III subunit beta [Pseudomonadota bacterium]MDA1136549.1 DNA polymerase III subunit beta [Pseudomonadota bacterium]|tara:strand:- start:884 stop:1993 length:1110 start_codon:yes stop_codon:yes gene_type:complete